MSARRSVTVLLTLHHPNPLSLFVYTYTLYTKVEYSTFTPTYMYMYVVLDTCATERIGRAPSKRPCLNYY